MFNRWKKWFLLGISLTLFLLIFIVINKYQHNNSIVVSIESEYETINYSIKSNIPDYKTVETSKTSEIISKITSSLTTDRTSGSFFIFGQNKTVIPSQLNILFEDINKLSQDQIKLLYNPVRTGADYIAVFDSQYDQNQNILTYIIYTNPQIYQDKNLETITHSWTYLLIKSFVLGQSRIELAPDAEAKTIEILEEVKEIGVPFEIKSTKLLNFIPKIDLPRFGVKSVFAQCVGNISCGQTLTTWYCDLNPSVSCPTPGQLCTNPANGTCVSSTTCDSSGSGIDRDCGYKGTYSTCTNQTGTCADGNCLLFYSCSWTGAPPAVCGNGIAEAGETCGEPGLTCPIGYYCSSCQCYVSGTSGDPSDPGAPSGSCVSDFCAGTDQCTALGGTTGAIGPRPSGGDCSPGTLMCCIDSDPGGGALPLDCQIDWGGFADPSPIFVGDNIIIPVRIQYTTVSTTGYIRLYGDCGGSTACDISTTPWYLWGTVRDEMNRRIPVVLSSNEVANNVTYEIKGYVRNSFTEQKFPCSSIFRNLDILAQYKWFQASGGSAVAMSGSINVNLPAGMPLMTTYPNQDLGAAAFAGVIDLGEGQVSANNYRIRDSFNYDFPSYTDFVSYIPSTSGITDISSSINSPDLQLLGATDSKGYVWLRSNSSLTINSDYSALDRKVILFVDGDTTINGNITLANTNSFFMIIASGDIIISNVVTAGANPALEGVFYAQNQFRTLSSGIVDDQLVIRGSVAANNFSLNRSLDPSLVDITPAETFEFGPEILLNYPRTLNKVTVKWREIAP